MDKRKTLKELLKHRYAHRGFHNKPKVPENSMTAFCHAAAHGFGIELDVHLTKDGRLAVIHDSSLKRTCGGGYIISDSNQVPASASAENIMKISDSVHRNRNIY